MGHTEVAKTPSKTVYDLCSGRFKGIFDKSVRHTVSACNNIVENVAVKILCHNDDDRNSENCNEHKKTLEKVCPTYSVITAEECVYNEDNGEDEHCDASVDLGEKGCENICTCNECGSNVNREANEEHGSASYLQSFALCNKAIGKILRKRDRVVSCLRKTAQATCNKYPVECCADGKTNAYPSLTQAECKNAAG